MKKVLVADQFKSVSVNGKRLFMAAGAQRR